MQPKDSTSPITDPDEQSEGPEETPREPKKYGKYDSGPRRGKAVREHKHQVHLDEIEDHKIRALAESQNLSLSSTLRRLIRVGLTLYPQGFHSGFHQPKNQKYQPWHEGDPPTKRQRAAAEILRRQELREAVGLPRQGRPRDPNTDHREKWKREWSERLRAAHPEQTGEDEEG